MKRSVLGASVLAALVMTAGCATHSQQGAQTAAAVSSDVPQAQEQWTTFKDHAQDVTAGQVQPAAGQATVTFFRRADAVGSAINVYVNGDYATTLLPGAARSVTVCAGENRLMAAVVDDSGSYAGKHDAGVPVAIAAGQAMSIELLQPAQGQLAFRPVQGDAPADVDALKGQNHPISRVNLSGCSI